MLRAKRITPAGCSRVSREARRGVIAVPSKPTMRSWPMSFFDPEMRRVALMSDFFLQCGQQIQSLEGCEPVQVYCTQLFQNRLRDWREDGQLGRRRRRAGREVAGEFALGLLMLRQNFSGAGNDVIR